MLGGTLHVPRGFYHEALGRMTHDEVIERCNACPVPTPGEHYGLYGDVADMWCAKAKVWLGDLEFLPELDMLPCERWGD